MHHVFTACKLKHSPSGGQWNVCVVSVSVFCQLLRHLHSFIVQTVGPQACIKLVVSTVVENFSRNRYSTKSTMKSNVFVLFELLACVLLLEGLHAQKEGNGLHKGST
ncbi:uncharacterized protein LOC129766876 [Toxorhynchites rutilus septentrionalis]|uniref:uncharacterized protein LOC129766876 n=1 Tax=Toxorhynchites rutilus septentrionalis TaxID=329112 RepID=UPI00247A1620|nr:uncharacterized protein LOC129766876 [Toxorhynchites rutilus septentrionalis]